MSQFSHFDESGKIKMVDVTDKSITTRTAKARALVVMSRKTLQLIKSDEIAKGNPLEIARVSGILAAKNTAQLIPLCHPLALSHVDVEFTVEKDGIALRATATLTGKTGVEMEALTAVAVAALTLYDMCKAVDKGMSIGGIRVVEKTKR